MIKQIKINNNNNIRIFIVNLEQQFINNFNQIKLIK